MPEMPPAQPTGGDHHDDGTARPHEVVARHVDLVEQHWRRRGLGAATRRRLGAELEASLVAALDSGAGLAEVLDVDAATLAHDIAAAEGLALLPEQALRHATLTGLVVRGVGSMVAAAGAFWFFALVPLANFFYRDATTSSLVMSLVMIYGTGLVLVLAAGGVAMQRHLREEPDARRTAMLATASAALGGLVGVAICLGIAATSDYSDAPGTVLTYVVVTGGLCAGGIALVWQRRRPAPASGDLVESGSPGR